jgi:anti-anti-sigma regulatory factor
VADTFVHDGVDSDQCWYTIDDRGACVVLSVGGRVDVLNCVGVCDALLVASSFSSGVVIDLRRAEFAQAEAAGEFVRSLQQSQRDGSSVSVVGPPEPVTWLLRVSAEAADVPVRASMTEAVAALAQPKQPAAPT